MSDTDPAPAPEQEAAPTQESTGDVMLRVDDQPYVEGLTVATSTGDPVTITTEPTGVAVDPADVDAVYEAAANAKIRLVEVVDEEGT